MGLAVNGLLDGETLGFRDTVGFCEIVGEAVTGGAVRSMDMPLPLLPDLLFFMRKTGLLLLFVTEGLLLDFASAGEPLVFDPFPFPFPFPAPFPLLSAIISMVLDPS